MSALTHFLLQLASVLGVAHVLRGLARRVRQPVVVAETMAGILLGPSVLGALSPRVSAFLFPERTLPVLGFVSEIGSIFFMFLVGLELDVRLLRGRMRAAAAIVPGAAFVPFMLSVPLALYLHRHVGDSQSKTLPFVLFVGAAMTVTAVPVLARILMERQMLRTQLGTLTIASAAGVDSVACCALAFALAASRGRGWTLALVTTSLVLAFVALMIALVRPVLAKLTAWAMASSEVMPHSVLAGVFLLLLASSIASDLAGATPLFGAFLFGAIVPKRSGFARHLAEKVEDVVLVVFLPLYFAHTGLRTQIGLLHDAWAWKTCALVILVGCVGKIGGGALAARWAGLGWREAGTLGVLMNTRGLMALIALNIGLDLGILTPDVFTMLIVMMLVTTLLTGPLLDVLYPPRLAARDVLSVAAVPARAEPKGFTVVACVPDVGRTSGLRALACAMASLPRSRVFALKLVAPTERASLLLDQQAEALAQPQPDGLRPLSFVSGRPARDVCDLADLKGADLILLEHGSLEAEVIRSARVPVAVLVDRGLRTLERVVTVDSTRRCEDRAREDALRLATRLARGAPIHRLDSMGELRPDGDLIVAFAGDLERELRDSAASVLCVHSCAQEANEAVSHQVRAGV